MAKKTQLIKVGYRAEAPVKADLSYWANLAAEALDLWDETVVAAQQVWGTLKAAYNLVLQAVGLVTALIPIVRSFMKRWLDIIRAARPPQ
jgi:hypothetical protein